MQNRNAFKEQVLHIVRQIPAGKTMTYGEVAHQAGFPGAARAVGQVMARNQDLNVPCHRVIRSDGSLAGYNGLRGITKAELLELEKQCN